VCVRACVFTCVRVRACVCTRYDRCNWRFSAPSLIGLRIGLRRDCRHWWGRCATTCACPRGGVGTCVQWTSSVVLSSVLSFVLHPRHNRAMRIALLQGTCHRPTTASAAGEPARRRRRTPQEPLLLRAKTLENSLLLGSFLGRIFTIWRPEFSHFHRAQNSHHHSDSALSRGGAAAARLRSGSPRVRHPRWQEYSPRRSDGSGAPGRGGGDNGVLAGPALWPSRHSGAQVATHLQHEREHLVSTPALLRPAGRCAGGCRARV
jgi:hypothetical protein